MRNLELSRLLHLDALDINFYGVEGFRRHGLRFKHGDLVRAKSGYTARAEMEKHRCSGISGHTHRLGSAKHTDKEGVTTEWWEAGHLCDVDKAEYTKNPDWQAGMLKIHVSQDGFKVIPLEF